MAKRNTSPSKKSVKADLSSSPETNSNSTLKWIIGGAAFLVILGFVIFTMTNENPTTHEALPNSLQSPTTENIDTTSQSSDPTTANTVLGDLGKKITGDWYVKERLLAGNPITKGKIGMGSWQFYSDGSLKYTTGQYADLGTWKTDGNNLNVSLYALGNYSGNVTGLDSKNMIWVTKETIDGKEVEVTNRLARR